MGVQFVEQTFAHAANARNMDAFFANNTNRALVISFDEGYSVPDVRIIPCQDQSQWKKLMWALNQDAASGVSRSTIVLHDMSDLLRLRRAVALKHLVELNNGSEALALDQFRVGQFILVPDIDPKQVHIIDEDVAKYFFHTEHYYAATLQAIQQAIDTLEDALDHVPILN